MKQLVNYVLARQLEEFYHQNMQHTQMGEPHASNYRMFRRRLCVVAFAEQTIAPHWRQMLASGLFSCTARERARKHHPELHNCKQNS